MSIDGDSEQGVRLDLTLVPDECVKILVAAAIDGEMASGDVGAVSVSLDGTDSTVATAVLDAATIERSMLLAEIYRVRLVAYNPSTQYAHLGSDILILARVSFHDPYLW